MINNHNKENDMNFHFNSFGQDYDLIPRFSKYAAGDRVCLELWYEEEIDEGETYMAPFAKVTVNMPDIHLNEGEVLVKDWSENGPLVEALVEAGWLLPTGREVNSGYVFPMVARLGAPLQDLL
jgi:hypothetical protein